MIAKGNWMTTPLNLCRHCKKDRNGHDVRDLCRRCYRDESIRIQYAPKKPTINRGYKELIDMTEEELDKMVDERRATMPGKTAEEIAEDEEPEPYTIPIIRPKYRLNRIPEWM